MHFKEAVQVAIASIASTLRGGDGRCDQCRNWPPLRTAYEPPEMEELGRRYAPDAPPNPPERCEACGFKPLSIVVQYVEDWPRWAGEKTD